MHEDRATSPTGLGSGDAFGTNASPVRVAVLLPLPLAGAYDYLAPRELDLRAGDFVEVPLGSRRVVGVVWDDRGDALPVASGRLKPIVRRFDVPRLPQVLRRFVEWVAGYTMAAPGAVLRMAMSVPQALEPPKPSQGYRLAEQARDIVSGSDLTAHHGCARADAWERLASTYAIKMTDARRRMILTAADGLARTPVELARTAAAGPSVAKGLAAAGLLQRVDLPSPQAFAPPDWRRPGPPLSGAQAAAATDLRGKMRAGVFSVTLLDGVTGSGKTEVYFEAVAAALEAGGQVLVLLPEIALSVQWLDRFAERFGSRPAEWHSDLNQAERRRIWRAVAGGEARIVVGARSALFLPFPDLSLIVVDEEHDGAFKQEDGVIYHARDMAVVRARLGGFAVALVSATPSLETMMNAKSRRYDCLHLPARHGGATLPDVHLVDLRKDQPARVPSLGQAWLSTALRQAMADTFAAGEQAMLFLNRRGYAPLTLCRACGHRLQCPNCTAWLVEHRLAGRLLCHHCGHTETLARTCPECGAEDTLAACGPGVERVAEETAALFPDRRFAIMASDTISGPAAAAAVVRAIRAHEIDLLIGTQIVAKGHHFPLLTLVGVVDADLGLTGGDLRAAERTYQVLHQVTGRAGRAERAGRALLQTHEPDHPVMQALVSGERDAFLDLEAKRREVANMPPFARLVAVILSAPSAQLVDEAARTLTRNAPHRPGVEVLGPAPAPLALLRGRHRRRFLVRTSRRIAPQGVIRTWLGPARLPGSVRVQIDVDPQSFL